MNNEQKGGASPHNADIAKAIVRSAGDAATNAAMDNKTRSTHNSAGGPNYHYQDAGSGWGGNVGR